MRPRYIFSQIPVYLLCGSTIVLRAASQGTQNSLLNADTDAFINQVLLDWNSPGGAAVAVVRRSDQGAWNVETKGYGIATANGSKVSEKTLFAIGSNSKLFNILATGLLIDNATLSPRLSWTSKIASVVPDWGLMDPITTKQATIIDVMSHRTGLPRHDIMYRWSDSVPTVIKRLKYLRPSAEFRDVWQYDNNMYTLLSYLPTLLLPSKIPFARYVKQHIFDSLGMSSTTYSYDQANSSGELADGMTRQGVNFSENPFGNGTAIRALPYWSTTGGEDGNVLSGAGGVISNAVDMATWLQTLLLNGVKPGTNQSVLPADAVQTVATGYTVVSGVAPFPELSPVVYGGGQTRGTYRGHELVEHDGGVPGFLSRISRLPSDDIGVAVLTNDDIYGGLIMEIIKGRILDDALGLERVDWNGRLRALAAIPTPGGTRRPANASLPSINFTSLAGTYNNPGYGTMELCFVSSPNTATSPSCKALASNASTILPGAIDPSVPTFLARWDSPWMSHIKMAHFDGNLFNATAVKSLPTGNASEPYWASGNSDIDSGTLAEFTVADGRIGFGITGIWGAGSGVSSPMGKSVRERAEVFFSQA